MILINNFNIKSSFRNSKVILRIIKFSAVAKQQNICFHNLVIKKHYTQYTIEHN